MMNTVFILFSLCIMCLIERSLGISIDLNSKLAASDGVSGDRFGNSVDVSDNGNYAIVAAYGYNNYDGKVYIYEYDSSNSLWIENTVVTHPTASPNNGYQFGNSVSISDNGYAIVGCPDDDITYERQGSAFIYGRDDTTNEWNLVASLTHGYPDENDFFGESVSISGDYAIVGCTGDDNYVGSAFIYQLDSTSGNTWNQFGDRLVPFVDDYSSRGRFGNSVSITSGSNGVFAIIGASSYSAFIFEYDHTSGSFNQVSMLTADDGKNGDFFGTSVSISLDDSTGNVNAIVGAYGDWTDKGIGSGSAYIFEREMDSNGGIEWNQISKLVSYDGKTSQWCGKSVSIYNSVAMVGCSDGNSVYVYEKNITWSFSSKITADDSQSGDRFGESVSVTNSVAIIGARFAEDETGNAYVYSVILDPTTEPTNFPTIMPSAVPVSGTIFVKRSSSGRWIGIYDSINSYTWLEALDYCESVYGTSLASYNSELDELEVSLARYDYSFEAWIGLTDSLNEGEWKWSDGNCYNYEINWYDDQPNNENSYGDSEDYVEFLSNTNELNDLSKNSKLNSFICNAPTYTCYVNNTTDITDQNDQTTILVYSRNLQNNDYDYVTFVANTPTNSNNNYNNNNSFYQIAIVSFIGGILCAWLSLMFWRKVRQICSKTHKKLINNSEYQSLL